MKLVLRPAGADIIYRAFFREPILEHSRDEPRFALVRTIMKNYIIRLNDIKFNHERPSDNWISFSKFYGRTFFTASLGVEEVNATLREPTEESQVRDIYNRFYELFSEFDLSTQRMNVHRQFFSEGNVQEYLGTLNPYTPANFVDLVDGRGISYQLKVTKHDLRVFITAVNSFFIENGLYLSVEFNFLPNKYDFPTAYNIARDHYKFILAELNLVIKEEN